MLPTTARKHFTPNEGSCPTCGPPQPHVHNACPTCGHERQTLTETMASDMLASRPEPDQGHEAFE